MSEASTLSPVGPLPALDLYSERAVTREESIDRWGAALVGLAVCRGARLRALAISRIVPAVERHGRVASELADDALREAVREVRGALRRTSELEFDTIARSFALIRESASRVLGMRHFDVQLMGGYALLRGMVAEMEAGEGKTLTATLAAATAALAGRPVHVVTVNDYLARRDAEEMRALYTSLELSVGLVVSGQSPDDRRRAYGCDITYCTNKDLTFDYMRDRLVLGARSGNLALKAERLYGEASRVPKLIMRGLGFAIVDEADSVLVDEARTPLIISGEVDPPIALETLHQALDAARRLEADVHFTVSASERRVELTARGSQALSEMTATLGKPWGIPALREELVRLALAALHVFHRDDDYLVADGKVAIIDEYTGRVMPDRQWSQGLHQLVELKEGCEPTGQRITLARLTYQRFFRRYKHLAGMSGTVREVAHELWRVYRLPVARIRTNRPLRRRRLRTRVAPTENEKWARIARYAARLHEQGRPVLLGTRSVAASMRASEALRALGLPHEVLNAAQDQREAEIVAGAGQPGRLTIATNMAGRGTDIRLGAGVAALGGLHVIVSERHDARRIDRQLAGRCARQGDPGSYQAILSLEDPLLRMIPPFMLERLLARRIPALARWLGVWALARAQRRLERRHSRMRRRLLHLDDRLGDSLAFSGKQE